MNKILLIFVLLVLIVLLLFIKVIYFPIDILNLFHVFHTLTSPIPHNTLVSDPITQFEPWRFFVKEQILQGQFPFWNNLNSAGVPLFANGQSAVLFPLNYFYYILPYNIALNLIPILKLLLLFTFSFLYLRSLSFSGRISFLGSFCITFAGFPMVWLLWPQTNVYLFLPIFLYITEKIKNTKNKSRWNIVLSLSYFFALLGGHYELLIQILVLHTLYIIYRFGKIKDILSNAIFISLGFLLASIQIVPSIEYLVNSYAIVHRTHSPLFYLPLQSFIQNFIPFILGAPHLQFYKPITITTNFQEAMGGYTGIIVLIMSICGAFGLIKKNSFVQFWILIAIFFWLLTYNIWPVSLILNLPLISQMQNTRLSAISGFAVIMIFIFSMKNLSLLLNKYSKLIAILYGGTVLLLFSIVLFLELLSISTLYHLINHPFIPILIAHIIFIGLTTVTFLFILKFHKHKNIFLILSLIIISSQTVFLLANYIPLISTSLYYPTPNIIKILKHKQGTLLEVGNPSILPDINLIYGVSLAENYDAFEIRDYKEEFNRSFPYKNHWGKVDRINIFQLNKFGINNILSDYNLNYIMQNIQQSYDSILGPLTPEKKISLNFKPINQKLSEIRILPANYNRRNLCSINLDLLESNSKKRVFNKQINCLQLLDKMFYTVDIKDVNLHTNQNYTLEIYSKDSNDKNAIGIWGNKNVPFMQVFYKSNNNKYNLISEGDNIKLFNVPGSSLITGIEKYKITRNIPTQFIFNYFAKENTKIEIKKVYYPGWKALIDGDKVLLLGNKPFININIPKGKHEIKLYYDPISFKIGFILSFMGIILLAFYILLKKFKTKILFLE